MKTGDLVTKNVGTFAYFNIWNLFQIPLHQNFRFWNSLLQLFDDDFRRETEVWVVFVKPKVVSNFCLAVFLKPKVVSSNISALWVVFFFLGKVSWAKNGCFLAKIHHKQGFNIIHVGGFVDWLLQHDTGGRGSLDSLYFIFWCLPKDRRNQWQTDMRSIVKWKYLDVLIWFQNCSRGR